MNDLGTLSQCILDGNAAALTQARRLRTKALAASAVLELAVGAALLLWPLLGPTEMLRAFNLTPVPPYRGLPDSTRVNREAEGTSRSTRRAIPLVFREPTPIPVHVSQSPEGPPNIEAEGAAVPDGLGIPDTTGDRPTALIPTPPPAAHGEAPLRRSTDVMNALLIRKVQPEYPELALNMHLSGEVRLRAVIGTDGSVQQLQVVSGNPILAKAARAAVQQWKYRPTQLDGTPVEVETIVTVDFILQQ